MLFISHACIIIFSRDTIRFEVQLSVVHLSTFITAGRKLDEFQMYFVHAFRIMFSIQQRYNLVRAPAACCLLYIPFKIKTGRKSDLSSSCILFISHACVFMFICDKIRLELQLSIVHFTYLHQCRREVGLEFQLYIVHFTCLCNHVHQKYNSVRAPTVCCSFNVPGNSSLCLLKLHLQVRRVQLFQRVWQRQ